MEAIHRLTVYAFQPSCYRPSRRMRHYLVLRAASSAAPSCICTDSDMCSGLDAFKSSQPWLKYGLISASPSQSAVERRTSPRQCRTGGQWDGSYLLWSPPLCLVLGHATEGFLHGSRNSNLIVCRLFSNTYDPATLPLAVGSQLVTICTCLLARKTPRCPRGLKSYLAIAREAEIARKDVYNG